MSAVSGSSRAGAPWRFDAIGTRWEVATDAPLDEAARARVTDVIDRFDAEWSRFRGDSVVTQLGVRGGTVAAPPDAAAMLEVYERLSDATDGAVNPLVGASLERLGYDAAYSLTG